MNPAAEHLDLVGVGSGVAGLSAAVRAADHGLRVGVMGHMAHAGQAGQGAVGDVFDQFLGVDMHRHNGIGITVNDFDWHGQAVILRCHFNHMRAELVDLLRIGAAGAAIVKPSRIALNPDCGFAPDYGGTAEYR